MEQQIENISLQGVVDTIGPIFRSDIVASYNEDEVITITPETKSYEAEISPNAYQKACWDLALPTARTATYMGFGLAGEVGEVLSLYAKAVRDEHGVDNETLAKELGDCMWFVAGICSLAGLSLDEVMKKNLEKLNSRKARGKLQGSGDDR